MDIDMELLRRVGELKVAVGRLETPEDLASVRATFGRVQERAKELPDPVAGTLRALEGALPVAPLSGGEAAGAADEIRSVLDILEHVLFDGSDEEAAARLIQTAAALPVRTEAEAEPLADAASPPSQSSDLPAEAGSSASEVEPADVDEDVSLHSVAAYLIQMEPTLMDSIESLRGHFAQAIERWEGSQETESQLVDALGELDAVLANKRTRKTKRVEAVDTVSEAIEAAMEEEQDYVFWSPPGTRWDDGDEQTRVRSGAATNEPAGSFAMGP